MDNILPKNFMSSNKFENLNQSYEVVITNKSLINKLWKHNTILTNKETLISEVIRCQL